MPPAQRSTVIWLSSRRVTGLTVRLLNPRDVRAIRGDGLTLFRQSAAADRSRARRRRPRVDDRGDVEGQRPGVLPFDRPADDQRASSPPRLPNVFMKPVTTPACAAATSSGAAQQALSARSAEPSASASSTALAAGCGTASRRTAERRWSGTPRSRVRSAPRAGRGRAPGGRSASRRPRPRCPASRNGSDAKKPPPSAENPSSLIR